MSPVTQHAPTQVTQLLDAFFRSYYARRPVNATFTGVHAHDSALPDWSPSGLASLAAEARQQRVGFAAERMVASAVAPTVPSGPGTPAHWARVDGDVADAFLELQLSELSGRHFQKGNPALAAGEAIFSIVSLTTRDYAPAAERVPHIERRLAGMMEFLRGALAALSGAPMRAAWVTRTRRECLAGARLMREGVPLWAERAGLPEGIVALLAALGDDAARALEEYSAAVDALPAPPDAPYAVGAAHLTLALHRGHWCRTDLSLLRTQARAALKEAQDQLRERAAAAHADGWPGVQRELAALHPTAEGYLGAFGACWEACRAAATAHDLVTWPDVPIRYVELPAHTRDVAPDLYYLFYRSPAPFDTLPVVDYVVTPLPAEPDGVARHLAAWNDSVIKLNHVVHHGALGHHVQNWFAYRSPSRVGQVAAVDCASRIGMLAGGTMAEGWACYATDLMDEVGFLTPLESLSEQHTRVRLAARAVVDLELHVGLMTFAEAVTFYEREAGMPPAAATHEVVKNTMFPGTAVMYWLGTKAIHDLRAERRGTLGSRFSLRAFHDTLLGYGALPVLLVADLMRKAP